MPWTGPLHYVSPISYLASLKLLQVSPLSDFPPTSCHFDADNVRSNINVLTAIQNYTSRFAQGFDDIDLRFLVHYVGDVHQPLHLILRERGGNSDPVLFEKRHFSLHGVRLWTSKDLSKIFSTALGYAAHRQDPAHADQLHATLAQPPRGRHPTRQHL
jgi:hypothetical protein